MNIIINLPRSESRDYVDLLPPAPRFSFISFGGQIWYANVN